LSLSLLFVLEATITDIDKVGSLALKITDSWGVVHEHELKINDTLARENTWYADAYFVYNGGKESKVYFNTEEYPVRTY
jgi:hypothetical protein